MPGVERTGLRRKAAADPPPGIRLDPCALPDPGQPLAKLHQPADAVGRSKGLPREPVRKDGEPGEETESGDRVVWGLELEQERCAHLEAEGPRRRPPEVRVLRARFDAEMLVPARIGHCDVAVHAAQIVS